jgi:phosphoribosylpyrophosphate synthetase
MSEPHDFVNMRLIAGTASRALAEEVAVRLRVPLTIAKVKRFNDGESLP